jgi:hypothetical protein
MQKIDRYNLKPNKAADYKAWLKKNDDLLRNGAPAGRTYLGTWFAVQGFGEYDCESRWDFDDYAALGSGPGSDEFRALMDEWDEFGDSTRPQQSDLMKSEDDVRIY